MNQQDLDAFVATLEPAERAALVEVLKRRAQPWQRDAATAVPDDLVRQLVGDNAGRDIHQRSSPMPAGPRYMPEQVKRGSGWVNPQKLEPPPGQRYIDQLMDAQDAKDRAELVMQAVKQRAVDRALATPEETPKPE